MNLLKIIANFWPFLAKFFVESVQKLLFCLSLDDFYEKYDKISMKVLKKVFKSCAMMFNPKF